MSKFYGAIDVDDSYFNVALINTENGSLIHFRTLATVSAIIKKMKALNISLKDIRICYEATYLGYSLYRDLTKKGIKCEVIAPALIPREPGRKVKTDRIDSIKLANYYLKGLLTAIYIPDEEDEMARDLIRSRKLIVNQVKNIKKHIISLCKRMGYDYRKVRGTQNASYWTQLHYKWLEKTINQMDNNSPLQINLSTLLVILSNMEIQIDFYNHQIKEISERPKYNEKVKALKCFRGMDTLSSLETVTELGDIKRFPHPTNVTSYVGLSVKEYSSGGKELKFGITKQGNRVVRTSVIEASQFALKPPRISRALKARRKGAKPEIINIADRCMLRLSRKSTRMFINGKHRNKIKVACAREMLCFFWEALNKVA